MKSTDLFESYLAMVGETEAPNVYHRWSFLAVLGAWMGRRYFLPFGDSNINCNMYVMLMGNAGARKTTAIMRAVKFIKAAGYDKIAASKTSKEKFLLDLSGDSFVEPEDIMDRNIFGKTSGEDAEILIAAEEFNVFLGNGNLEFLSLLGALWDYEGDFDNKTKNSPSAFIHNPTISMIAGNTATSFALAFPIEAIGQGIFSRLLIIHGDKTNRKITIPPRPDEKLRTELLKRVQTLRTKVLGPAELNNTAYNLIDKIYKTYVGIPDIRFESYNNRRLTHLLKLCLLTSAMEGSKEVTEPHVIKANTILTHAEHTMPKALGEFGKAKNSDITNKVISVLEEAPAGFLKFKAIWSHVHNDLETPEQLKDILGSLQLADKIVAVPGGGFIAKRTAVITESSEVDFSLLTEEEQRSIIL